MRHKLVCKDPTCASFWCWKWPKRSTGDRLYVGPNVWVFLLLEGSMGSTGDWLYVGADRGAALHSAAEGAHARGAAHLHGCNE